MVLKVLVESALPAQIVLLMFDSNCLGTKAFERFIVLGGGLCFLLYIYIDIYIYTHTGAWLQVCQSCHEWLEPCSEVLSVLSVLFRCYHLYFRPKPAVHSHRSEQRLCGSCTARISHTLTTAVKTHLWENHCQTLRPLRLLLVSRGGFLFHLLQHCARLFNGVFTLLLRCIVAFPLALPYLLHFHGPWWTEFLQVELSQPVSLNQQGKGYSHCSSVKPNYCSAT